MPIIPVGDGFPVPPHTSFRMSRDGKPVPYEWMTINSPKFDGDSQVSSVLLYRNDRIFGPFNS